MSGAPQPQPRSGQGARPAGPTRTAVCVLWHPPNEIVDGRLLDAVNRKDLIVQCCTHAAAALAALLRHGRLAITRGEQPPPLILLLYHAEALPSAAALARALHRYAPQAICWVCSPSDELLLRAVSPSELHDELRSTPAAEPLAPDAESSPARERIARGRGGQSDQPKRTGAVCPMPRSTHGSGGRAGTKKPAETNSAQIAAPAETSAKIAFRTPGQRPRTSKAIVSRVTSEVSGPELAMLQDASVRLGNLAQRDQ